MNSPSCVCESFSCCASESECQMNSTLRAKPLQRHRLKRLSEMASQRPQQPQSDRDDGKGTVPKFPDENRASRARSICHHFVRSLLKKVYNYNDETGCPFREQIKRYATMA